jgi:hypothetical protein
MVMKISLVCEIHSIVAKYVVIQPMVIPSVFEPPYAKNNPQLLELVLV